MKIKTFYWLSVLASVLVLVGCNPRPVIQAQNNQADEASKTTVLRFADNGYLIKARPHEETLVLPTSRYFQPRIVQLDPHHNHSLADITRYVHDKIADHPHAEVLITGYPVKGQHNSGLSLSHQYAVVMASFFWNKGLAVRVVDTVASKNQLNTIKQALDGQSGVIIRVKT